MKDIMVRLSGITIRNFKNITHGTLSFENNRKSNNSSILGLYGQNGSGKTALIDAVELLQYILCGRQIPDRFADYINVNSDRSVIEYEFSVNLKQDNYRISYEVSYGKAKEIIEQNTDIQNSGSERYRVAIYRELLRTIILSERGRNRFGTLIDTDMENDDIFIPKSKFSLLVGKKKETATDLIVAKKLTGASSRSFVFSKELLTAIRNQKRNINSVESSLYTDLIEALVNYGNTELFIINTANSGLISLNAQPLIFKFEEKNHGTIGKIMLPLDRPVVINKKLTGVVKKVISNMNIVLEQIIPGMTIGIKELGSQVTEENQVGVRIQLMSNRGKTEIALKDESEGIKKIISILQLLIVVYNQSSITVAIDELDSGVFEYLLGELLRIISEKGKGQLIFTSHNLRPLETLNKSFIAFTTTNPEQRYIRLTNIKKNNNLRDFYYRDIMLGEQSEKIYDLTDNSEISFAFREAGDAIGT